MTKATSPHGPAAKDLGLLLIPASVLQKVFCIANVSFPGPYCRHFSRRAATVRAAYTQTLTIHIWLRWLKKAQNPWRFPGGAAVRVGFISLGHSAVTSLVIPWTLIITWNTCRPLGTFGILQLRAIFRISLVMWPLRLWEGRAPGDGVAPVETSAGMNTGKSDMTKEQQCSTSNCSMLRIQIVFINPKDPLKRRSTLGLSWSDRSDHGGQLEGTICTVYSLWTLVKHVLQVCDQEINSHVFFPSIFTILLRKW